MATSLLRIGRLASVKCLQLESLGALRSRPIARLCTGAKEPTKAKKAAAPPPPPVEPEEPFDNTTYKNCQHHEYTPYTFADLDVEMSKYRLPQPSSGRPSPRH
uniref:NADH dehydrogenase [ubiquinone] flavoprotein 3, mitochondrial n=1 Tax=Neogobius melanostomus TaxID=47308 RepID=A0A8C6U1J1_9GOBI